MKKEDADKQSSGQESGFWEEAKDNIGDGARELGQKISSYSEIIFGKIKDRTSDMLQHGKELTQDAVNKAQEKAEEMRDKLEIRKLNEEKKKIAAQLGMNYYLALKNNDNKTPPNFTRQKEIVSLLQEIEDIDKEILKISEET